MIISTGAFPDAVVIDDMASTLDIIRAYLKGVLVMPHEDMIGMIDESLGMVHEPDNTQSGDTP